MRLNRRVAALEMDHGRGDLSPAVKAWLGQPLTAAEQQALATGSLVADPVDTTTLSKELKTWLGID